MILRRAWVSWMLSWTEFCRSNRHCARTKKKRLFCKKEIIPENFLMLCLLLPQIGRSSLSVFFYTLLCVNLKFLNLNNALSTWNFLNLNNTKNDGLFFLAMTSIREIMISWQVFQNLLGLCCTKILSFADTS